MRGLLIHTIVIALVTLGTAAAGRAQEGLTPLDTTMSDAELERRIRFIEQRLEARKRHGQIWHWGWMTVKAGSMVGNTIAAAATDDHDDTVKFATAATLGAIGTAHLLVRPLEARYGAAPVSGRPEATREEKLAKLRAGEDQLRRNAKRANERKSLVAHGSNAALATVAGLVVGLWGNPSDGVIMGLSSFAGGTASILTEPAAPAQDWEDYKALGGRSSQTKLRFNVTALPDGAMIGFNLSW